jgi:hypothetical protein
MAGTLPKRLNSGQSGETGILVYMYFFCSPEFVLYPGVFLLPIHPIPYLHRVIQQGLKQHVAWLGFRMRTEIYQRLFEGQGIQSAEIDIGRHFR